MPHTLVDSSVLLDLIRHDEEWLDWSGSMLSARGEIGRLCISGLDVLTRDARRIRTYFPTVRVIAP